MSGLITSKKKLLFVSPSLGGGGAERVVVNLINYLDKDKYNILLVIFSDKRDYQEDLPPSVKVICVQKKNRLNFFKLILGLRRVMHDYRPDVVVSFVLYFNIVAVIASLFSERKFRLIISERNYPRKYLPELHLGWLMRWLINVTYPKADKILTVSKSIEMVLKEDFNIPPKKLQTIYNPVPIEEIKVKSQKEIKLPFLKDDNTQIIISAGRLVKQKRFDMLLRAVSLIRKKQDNVHLIILGEGKLRGELEGLAAQLNISRWVNFVGFKSNPYAWISNADIFVLTSDFEGFPNVLVEAMACGLPVVSTDCPSGPGEIITNGKNGILVPPANEEALAEAILGLLKDEILRKKFSAEGKKRVEDFKVEEIIKQYEQLF